LKQKPLERRGLLFLSSDTRYRRTFIYNITNSETEMDALVDQPMTDAVSTEDPRLPLSADEQKVLDLWDQIQQLQLEIAIINAHNKIQPSTIFFLS
jgi:hypothetical protein